MKAATAALAGYFVPRGAIKEIVLRCSRSRSERNLALYAASYLQRQLRCDRIRLHSQRDLPETVIALPHWQHERANIHNFDRLFAQVQREGDFRLVLSSRDWLEGLQSALELLNRYQCMLPLPLDYRPLPQVLELLSGLHAAPADVQGGIRPDEDAWRWLIRLAAEPPRAVQLAALFHPAFVPQHGNRTRTVWTALERQGFSRAELSRMLELLSQVESDDTLDPDLALLKDAHGLAFFSAHSWQYFREHGQAQTRETVRQLVARISNRALCLALATRQPPAVSLMLEDALDVGRPPDSGIRCT